jgi:hypothetical protein
MRGQSRWLMIDIHKKFILINLRTFIYLSIFINVFKPGLVVDPAQDQGHEFWSGQPQFFL